MANQSTAGRMAKNIQRKGKVTTETQQTITQGLAHLAHYDRHWEFCCNYEARVDYIRNFKPREEQELRLKLFKIVPEALIPGKDSSEWQTYKQAAIAETEAEIVYDKAQKAFPASSEAYDTAWKAYADAIVASPKAWANYMLARSEELAELHDRLFPDCPWKDEG